MSRRTGFEGGKVAHERIYWDQASLLVQLRGLEPSRVPVSGAEQAAKVPDKDRPCNGLIERAAQRPAIAPHHRVGPMGGCPTGRPPAGRTGALTGDSRQGRS
jgi:hypothetical protein